MFEMLGWVVAMLYVLSAIGIIDLTIDVSKHVEGEKVVCVRGKAG